MKKEDYEILKLLKTSPDLSQRDLSKISGISLGKINSIIKRFLDNNIIQVLKLDSRTNRYYLTEQGQNLLCKNISSNIYSSYYLIKKLILKFKILQKKNNILNIPLNILLIPEDPINNIILDIIEDYHISANIFFDIQYFDNFNSLIYIFNNSIKKELLEKTIKFINILEDL